MFIKSYFFFLSKPQAWYIITARSAVYIISPYGDVSHHASACISLRLDDIPQQVADDIQCDPLMICNGKPLIYFLKYGIMRLKSKADMLSKFEIALKECSETEGWLQLLFNTQIINEETFKSHRNLCGRIRRMLIASCKTLKENTK